LLRYKLPLAAKAYKKNKNKNSWTRTLIDTVKEEFLKN